jgi:hypothetical protein
MKNFRMPVETAMPACGPLSTGAAHASYESGTFSSTLTMFENSQFVLRRRHMWVKFVPVFGLVLTIATAASAQSKFSGTQQCAKPDPVYTVPVGDRPDHMISLIKDKCTWTAGEIGGIQLKEEDDTIVSDSSGSRARDRGNGVATLANGERAFVQFQGTTTLKDKAPVTGEGTWSFTSGTGKQKGLKGKGTFKGKWNADGTSTFEIEGEYQLMTATGGK